MAPLDMTARLVFCLHIFNSSNLSDRLHHGTVHTLHTDDRNSGIGYIAQQTDYLQCPCIEHFCYRRRQTGMLA